MAQSVATIPSPTSGSVVIQPNFVNQAPVLGGAIWKYSYAKNKWSRMMKRGVLEDGQGDALRTMYNERPILGTTGRATWARHAATALSALPTGTTPPDIGVGRGLPPVTVMQTASKVREFYRYWCAIQSTRIDANDARLAWKYKEQVKNMYDGLFDVTDREWGRMLRLSYFQNCANKIIIGATATSTSVTADLGVVNPTDLSTMVQYTLAEMNATTVNSSLLASPEHSVLTGGVLRGIYPRLERLGASRNPPGRSTGGRPAYVLMCSMEQCDYLMREPGARGDHRWDDASVLLKPMGVCEAVGGYTYIQDDECPRFTLALNGSKYDFTEVTPWSLQAGWYEADIASAASGGTGFTILTLDSGQVTTGLVAGNIIRISVDSASDGTMNGEFRVSAVPSSTTVTIEATYEGDTFDGKLTLLGSNSQSYAVENPSYQNAPYEMSFIVHPEVMEILTPPPLSDLGSGVKVNPAKTLGEFSWMNILNEDSNPRGTIGYFDGVLEFAAKPMKNFGYAILHRRATPEYLASPSFAVTQGLGLNAA